MGNDRYSRTIVAMDHRVPDQNAMQFRLRARTMKVMTLTVGPLLSSVMLFAFVHAHAAQLTVRAVDPRGTAVQDLLVIAEPLAAAQQRAELRSANDNRAPAVMDQIDRRFVPQIVAVSVGTAVLFPNSDSVAHQVYSFSPARRFELGLYRGRPHPPVAFDKPGIVVVGCNIHDNMVGYIYVTDAPYFGASDAAGEWRTATIAPGDYRVRLWSPRLAKSDSSLQQSVTIREGQDQALTFRLSAPLLSIGEQRIEPRVRDY
jgi:plastocyanin